MARDVKKLFIVSCRLGFSLFYLFILPSFSFAAPKENKLSDEQIKEVALKKLTHVQDLKLDVQAGHVVVSGVVTSYFEKRDAARELLVIRGVNRVENKISVNPEARIDSQIKNNLNSALVAQAWFLPRLRRNIAVKVEKNVVTLNGSVETLREKNLIQELVGAIRGVKDIINNISVIQSNLTRSNDEIRKEAELFLAAELGDDTARLISVEVDGNEITLKGKVRSYCEKMAAYHATEWVVGVRSIINLLEID